MVIRELWPPELRQRVLLQLLEHNLDRLHQLRVLALAHERGILFHFHIRSDADVFDFPLSAERVVDA